MGKIIGLVCNSKLNQDLVNNDQYLFSNNYIKRLREQGGTPIGLLPVEGRLEEDVLEMCDAILICGGTNFTPAHLQAAHHAVTHGKPLMGICLGLQTIHRYFNIMDAMAEEYPAYGFAVHKGYGTKAHYAALTEHGPCAIHRMSFLKKFYGQK